jgi:hypothetical protein
MRPRRNWDRIRGSTRGQTVSIMPLPTDVMIKAAFLFVWVICCFAVLNFKQIRRLKKLAAHFNGSLAPYSLFVPTLQSSCEGLRFRVHAGIRFLEVPGTLSIRLFVTSSVELRVYQRSSMMKAARKTSLFPEVRTGDSLFDAEFVILSRHGEIARSYLQQPAVRQDLKALFGQGFWMLVIGKHGTWTEKLAYDQQLDLEPIHVAAVLRYLKTMATGV